MNHILIVEDECIIRSALRRLLERHHYQVSEAGSVQEAKAQSANFTEFDLIIADLRLPGEPGTSLLFPGQQVPVLIMTSYASISSAVDSMKMGAVDYIAKPFDHNELLLSVERILQQHTPHRPNTALTSSLSRTCLVHGMIGHCPSMCTVFERIQKVAPTDTTVLILGESGTGKELVARALHENSLRCNAPMITVNCAAIPDNLIESELFGHEKGSFTGAATLHRGLIEAADNGTLFLDEVGELPPDIQARLLRVLQEGEIRRVGSTRSLKVNIRLLAATHRNLAQWVLDGRFRNDLYYRLHVMEICLPPLRDRGDDIVILAQELLHKACQHLNRPSMQFTETALKDIRRYSWPGNVREMKNAVERAVILCEDCCIDTELLAINPDEILFQDKHSKVNVHYPESFSEENCQDKLSLEEYFRRFVLTHQGSLTETELAKRLGISRKSLWERRQRLGIPRRQ